LAVEPGTDPARVAAMALAEDGSIDATSEIAVPADMVATGVIEFRTPGIVAGLSYADAVVHAAGLPAVGWEHRDGDQLPKSAVLGRLQGNLRAILRAERPLLNLLQRASGIATATRAAVELVRGTGARILHTRKTAPGLRLFDAAAVMAGGGEVHRLDLAHEVMIKDNHWRALEQSGVPLDAALEAARKRGIRKLHVEVETEAQVRAASAAGATRLLIDNQSPETVQRWRALARSLAPRIEIEATGGIDLSNIRRYAEAGADYISLGALTHSVKAADIALEVNGER
jgi:nicotinate-nucleotide pyrophosphorylase (carboxylating)